MSRSIKFIKHKNMRTVMFKPEKRDENETHYLFWGWWYCNQTRSLIAKPETIKILKDNWKDWNYVLLQAGSI